MQPEITIHFVETSTAIEVEVRDELGNVLARRDVTKNRMKHWVSHHADRNAAIEFDAAIDAACRRTDDEVDGSAYGIIEACTDVMALAAAAGF